MKILASRIAKGLKKAKHCALYEPDLSRVWFDDVRQREPQIASFAKTHGWRLATTKTDSAFQISRFRSQITAAKLPGVGVAVAAGVGVRLRSRRRRRINDS